MYKFKKKELVADADFPLKALLLYGQLDWDIELASDP